jgi:hypothetical protein
MFKLLVFIIINLIIISAFANETKLTGQVAANTRWIDNYFMDNRDISVLEEIISGQVTIDANSDRHKHKLILRAEGFVYQNKSLFDELFEANNTNQYLDYFFKKQMELDIIGFHYGYSDASDRDSQIDNNETVNQSKTKISSYNINWLHKLSEQTQLDSSLSYENTSYSDPQNIGSNYTTLNSFFKHQVTPLFIFYSGIYSYYYEPDSNTIGTTFHYSVVFGASYHLSEKWTMNGNINLGRTRSETVNYTPQFNLGLNYDTEIASWKFNAARTEESSSQGGIDITDSLSLSYMRSLSETLSIFSELSWQKSEGQNDDDYTFDLSMEWKLKDNIFSNIYYKYQQIDELSEKIDSNSVGVEFSYHWQ